MGNRTASSLGGTSTSYTYDNDDELTATSGGFVNSYTYNDNGEQTGRTLSGTSRTLTYDYDGQLTSTGTGGATFTYDAEGRRVSRTTGGVTTAFLYDGSRVLLEKQGSTTTGTYTYGNSLVRKDGETPLFDGLGSERTVTNGSGTVTGALTLSAFGQTVASTGSSTNAYQFGATSGYRNDGDAGLMQVGCRYYDAQVGRFTSRDTYLDQRPYAYCDGDPVNRLDRSGHVGIPILVPPSLQWPSGASGTISREPDPVQAPEPPIGVPDLPTGPGTTIGDPENNGGAGAVGPGDNGGVAVGGFGTGTINSGSWGVTFGLGGVIQPGGGDFGGGIQGVYGF